MDEIKNEEDKSFFQISSNFKSAKFVLAILIVIPSMIFFGYAIVSVEGKDKLLVLSMINTIALTVLATYFGDKPQVTK